MTIGAGERLLELRAVKEEPPSVFLWDEELMQDVLSPIHPDSVAADDLDTIVIVNEPSVGNAIFHSGIAIADDARIEVAGGKQSIDFFGILRNVVNAQSLDVLQFSKPEDPDALYAEGCEAWNNGETEASSQIFLTLSLLGHKTGSALYGLATSLCKSGKYQEALDLSLIVGASGHPHPRALILAGYAAYKIDDPNLGRRCLARASRIARGKPEYTEELRFAQRLLLTQHFGD